MGLHLENEVASC